MAKAVNLKQLTEWVRGNLDLTWFVGKDSFGEHNFSKSSLQIKYMDIVLDTRDMKVFSISVRGMGRKLNVNHGEDFEGSILELLSEKLKAEREQRDGEESTIEGQSKD